MTPTLRRLRAPALVSSLALSMLVGGFAPVSAADEAGPVGDRVGRHTIVFQSLRDGNDDIYAVNPDGTGLTRLTDDPAIDAAPSISPDRSAVLMVSERDGNSEVYRLDVASGATTRLTVDERFDFNPVYTHDGSTILFQRLTDNRFDLWTMRADGSDARRLTTLPLNEIGGVYSPDDALIAFMGNNGGNQDLRVMRSDGSDIRNVTEGWCTDATAGQSPCVLSRELMPAWTPDGRIVFVSDRTGSTQLWVMDADGSDATPLTAFEGGGVRLPAVSANGKIIAFELGDHLATVRIDGTGLRVLTSSLDFKVAMPY